MTFCVLQATASGQNFFFDMQNTGRSQGSGNKRHRDHGKHTIHYLSNNKKSKKSAYKNANIHYLFAVSEE